VAGCFSDDEIVSKAAWVAPDPFLRRSFPYVADLPERPSEWGHLSYVGDAGFMVVRIDPTDRIDPPELDGYLRKSARAPLERRLIRDAAE
jgi:hypothetical protein